ncbi:CASP-like protein 1C1 [Macadamia integrifolia]|uniref:CASP-like protein 1C1 n=1 Tax=Macadamia integrifolia TaxID=60698 RepID=UPI001C4ECA95|nr:CASP-like protein 1C1 [Macadamia integrifolia]
MAKAKRFCALLLRLIALAATLSAAIVMATSSQTTTVYGISFEAKYSFTPAFKFFVIANAIVSVYGFLVLFLPSESLLWRLVVALDVIITMLLTSSISAALAIAYVGKKGNSHAGWLPICGQVSKYCDRVTGALIAGFIAAIIYLLLLLHSIHTVLDPLLVSK